MIDRMAKAWLDATERKDRAIMDLSANLDMCKRSLLSAVTERDEARAEIDRLTFLHKQDHALADRYQEHREAAEREAERLRREIKTWGRMWDDLDLLAARVEALRNGTAILGSTDVT